MSHALSNSQRIVKARQMLSDGHGLAKVAHHVGMTPTALDVTLWRYAGKRVKGEPDKRGFEPGHKLSIHEPGRFTRFAIAEVRSRLERGQSPASIAAKFKMTVDEVERLA